MAKLFMPNGTRAGGAAGGQARTHARTHLQLSDLLYYLSLPKTEASLIRG